MAFTPEAPQFLFENYTMNDKQWFKEHKDIYQKEIVTPFTEIMTELVPLMEATDPKIVCKPGKISRIYRDVRLIKDGMFFKRSVWCSIMRPKEGRFDTKPEFFFWISPDDLGWGCGYYKTDTDVMQKIRELIISGDKTAKAALAAYKKLSKFTLSGEMYKRDHFPDQPPELKEWLNRKELSLFCASDDPEVYFSQELPKMVAEDMAKLVPVYKLFIKAQELCGK
ncbi:MAG: DUF2461 domain-containing protein [Ruminococcus sp.]|nr:DUF2461 domain-containing protein [Ruminococcus sp.]